MNGRERLFVLNDPHCMRVSKDLAREIGLDESMVLLQLEFLISISNVEIEGRRWKKATIDDLRDQHFDFWSRAKVARIVEGLIARKLIVVGNFNRVGYDRSRWFSLNFAEISKLESVAISHSETAESHSEIWAQSVDDGAQSDPKSLSQNETPTSQIARMDVSERADRFARNETTIEKELKDSKPTSAKPTTGSRQRKPDPIWDALVAIGLPQPTNDNERGRWNRACKLLRQSEATPEEIKARAARWRSEWSTATMTPLGLASNWATFAPTAPRRPKQTSWGPDELCSHGMPLIAVCDDCAGTADDPRAQLPRRAVSCVRTPPPVYSPCITARLDRVHPGQLELLTEGVF